MAAEKKQKFGILRDHHMLPTKERCRMNPVKAIWKDGRIVPGEPVNWPDGCEVLIEPVFVPLGKIGIDESEWRDDPDSIADWESWIATLQPLEFSAAEESAIARFDQQMRQYNIEAVRRQMADTQE